MKKIFTLALGMMITAAMFAADRRPVVTVSAARKYTVVIDGRQYRSDGSTMSIPNLFNGEHVVRVYKRKPGFFRNANKLVASSGFQVRKSTLTALARSKSANQDLVTIGVAMTMVEGTVMIMDNVIIMEKDSDR